MVWNFLHTRVPRRLTVIPLHRKAISCRLGCNRGFVWSKPEPDGKYTRPMIVDITERVLMEQEQARLRAQNLYLQEEIKADHNFEEVVGQSVPLLHVLENVGRVAPTDASVLISGETGTGKDLIARSIHNLSSRRERTLVKLNCAAIPTGLVVGGLLIARYGVGVAFLIAGVGVLLTGTTLLLLPDFRRFGKVRSFPRPPSTGS